MHFCLTRNQIKEKFNNLIIEILTQSHGPTIRKKGSFGLDFSVKQRPHIPTSFTLNTTVGSPSPISNKWSTMKNQVEYLEMLSSTTFGLSACTRQRNGMITFSCRSITSQKKRTKSHTNHKNHNSVCFGAMARVQSVHLHKHTRSAHRQGVLVDADVLTVGSAARAARGARERPLGGEVQGRQG